MPRQKRNPRMPGQTKSRIFRPTYVSGRLLHARMAKAFARIASDCGVNFTVVDAGCGRQPYRALAEFFGASYVGIDVAGSISAGYAPPDSLRIREDGTWPLDDGSADIAMSTQVLEHVGDVGGYLREARRVLKPGGRLLLSTHGAMILHDQQDFWRWTHKGLARLLAAHGFRVERVEPVVTTGANLLFLFTQVVWARLAKLPLVGFMFKLMYGPINVMTLLVDRTGKRDTDILPNILLAEGVKE